jgi:hypothetical protein
VKIWIAFLVASFLIGGRSYRKGSRDRVAMMLGVSLAIAATYYTYRGI